MLADQMRDYNSLPGHDPVHRGSPAFGVLIAKAVVAQADKLGITFHGAKVNGNIARSLQNIAAFVQSTSVQAAFRAFEEISHALNDQTNIAMLMQSKTRHIGEGIRSGHWCLRPDVDGIALDVGVQRHPQ